MLKSLVFALTLCLSALALPAAGQDAAQKDKAATAPGTVEQRIREVVEKISGQKVDSINKAPFLGLYEVMVAGDLLYTDEKATFLIAGDVYDLRGAQPRNLKEERLSKLNAIKFAELPLDQSFKIVRGNGKRQLAYFSDPNCSYCKRLDKDLMGAQDVTVHVFLYPILSADSSAKAKAVWCSPDRAKAWIDMMVNGVEPKASPTCDTPIDKNLALGQKYRITGTPTLVFENGQRVPGAMPVDKINGLLADAAKK